MAGQPQHRLPDRVELDYAQYRLAVLALEVALDVLDEFPAADPDGARRVEIDLALRPPVKKIWPDLGRLDEGE